MFFIVGSARSGTTLLRMMLNAHREVTVPPESRFVVELYQGDEVEVDDFLERLQDHKRFQAWDLPIASVKNELEGRERVPYREATEAVYRAFARARSKPLYGDKTPRYIEYIPFLNRLWPEARFVHMVRDGREVALSYADVPFGPKTVAKAAQLWSERVELGIRSGRSLAEGRYLEVRYERILEDPEGQARELCEFLGITFDGAMMDFGKRSRNEVLDRANRYNPNVTGKIERTRSWTEQMPEIQVETFEWVAGATLDSLGYERAHPEPGVRARVLAELGLRGLPVGRLRSSPRRSSRLA
jgi:hypothetical protein